jgi:hypothetical protein
MVYNIIKLESIDKMLLIDQNQMHSFNLAICMSSQLEMF